MLAPDTDWAKVSFSITAEELSVDCSAIRREPILSPAQWCTGCPLIHASWNLDNLLVAKHNWWREAAARAAVTLLARVRSSAFTWMELPDSLQWKKVEKCKIHCASTNRNNFRETKDDTGQEAKTALTDTGTWHCIFQESSSLTLLFSAETMPLTQAKSDHWVLTHEHGKELSPPLLAHRFWSCFSLREMQAMNTDAKASPSWLCPPALHVLGAVLSNSVPKEGHFRAFSWQVTDQSLWQTLNCNPASIPGFYFIMVTMTGWMEGRCSQLSKQIEEAKYRTSILTRNFPFLRFFPSQSFKKNLGHQSYFLVFLCWVLKKKS